jgi:nucleoside-diphosphate-sugar epimerase
MILVTGGLGFVGRSVVKHLASIGAETRTASSRSCDDPNHLFVDLRDRSSLAALPKAETVIHLAGTVRISLRPNPENRGAPPLPANGDLVDLYESNVMGTANLVEYCLKSDVRHLVFASTQAVYGYAEDRATLTEETALAPLEDYAASKVAAEILLRIAAKRGLAVTVLRSPGVYGEARRSGIVFRFCQQAVAARRIEVNLDMPLPLDVIHVDDVAAAFAAAAIKPAQNFRCFNVATGELCSADLLADDIAALVPGCTVKHASVPQPVIRMDSTRAHKILGWTGRPRQEGLRQLLKGLSHSG